MYLKILCIKKKTNKQLEKMREGVKWIVSWQEGKTPPCPQCKLQRMQRAWSDKAQEGVQGSGLTGTAQLGQGTEPAIPPTHLQPQDCFSLTSAGEFPEKKLLCRNACAWENPAARQLSTIPAGLLRTASSLSLTAQSRAAHRQRCSPKLQFLLSADNGHSLWTAAAILGNKTVRLKGWAQVFTP